MKVIVHGDLGVRVNGDDRANGMSAKRERKKMTPGVTSADMSEVRVTRHCRWQAEPRTGDIAVR